jgi:hypothetical protein
MAPGRSRRHLASKSCRSSVPVPTPIGHASAAVKQTIPESSTDTPQHIASRSAARHNMATGPAQVQRISQPPSGNAADNDARSSTVNAAFQVFRGVAPDFTDSDLRAALTASWRPDLSVHRCASDRDHGSTPPPHIPLLTLK